MTQLLPHARRFSIAGLAALAACGAAASSAHAIQTKTLTYKCKYPLIGTNPLSVKIDLDIPDTWPGGILTPEFPITAVATASGNTVPGLSLVEGLAAIRGVATATSTVTNAGGGTPQVVTVPIAIPTYVLPTPVPDPLVLNANGKTPSLSFDRSGEVTIKLDKLALNLEALDAAGEPIILPPVTKDIDLNPVKDSDGKPETFDVYCKLDAGLDTTLGRLTAIADDFPCDCIAPPAPSEGVMSPADFTPTSINLRWLAPAPEPDVRGYKEYVIRYEGTEIRVPYGQTSKLLTGLGADSEYFITISLVDNYGNESDPLELFYVTPSIALNVAPTRPGLPTLDAAGATQTELKFSWTPSTDPDGSVTGYDVYNGSAKVSTVSGNGATIAGLTPNTAYSIKVVAKDNGMPTLSTASDVAVLKTQPRVEDLSMRYSYTLAGSAALKTLTKGTLPLKGNVEANWTLATGAFVADLTLAPTQGRLTALGFLPVTAKIGFVPSSKTTGQLRDDVFTTNSKVRIKVQEVKLFGAIPLVGGNSCQTKSLSEINLKSTQPEFKLETGGPLAGTFAISDLNGCGALNGLVSPLTAGGGNTITLNLARKVF